MLIISMILFSGCQNPTIAIIDEYMETHLEDGIHNELAFALRINKTMAGGTTQYALFKPNDRKSHFNNRRINTKDLSNQIIDFTFIIYENVTVTTNATMVNTFNLERNSNVTSTMVVYDNPTGINLTGSTLLEPFGNTIVSERKSGEAYSDALEYVFKDDTYYLLIFENDGSGDIEVLYDVIWIEVEE